jgi:outer membrane protein OmpA-like peptidoglycan-associated protein
MTRVRSAGRWLLLATLAAVPAAARAQIPKFDLERLRLDPAATASLVQGVGELAPPGTWRLSFVIHGEARPLTYREDGLLLGNGFGGSTDRVEDYVSDRIGLHLLGSWTPARWLEIHAEVPVIGWQIGDDLTAVGVPNPKRTALAAPWLGVRVPVFGRSGPTGLSMAIAVDGSGPLGAKNSVAAPDGFVARPRLEVGQRFDSFVVGLEAGVLYRSTKVDVGPEQLGHEAVGGLVIATTGRTRGELALRGAMNMDKVGASAEALIGIRFRVAAFDAFVMGGPGFGDAPGTPRFRALLGVGWPARELDGSRSAAPAPAAPVRATPAPVPQPPPRPGVTRPPPAQAPVQAPAPAPAPVPVPPPPRGTSRARLESGRIALSEKIEFEPRSARIDQRSLGLLDEVVAILEANPTVSIVVEGHTDGAGPSGKNRQLSYNRAEAVKKFLVRRGIDATRIDARGFGETKPIRSNATEAGREANRRVEIKVK